MEILIEEIRKEIDRLSNALTLTDKLTQRNTGGFEKKYLVFSANKVRIRIDASQNHSLPHLHVDYGKEFHAVSISIINCEVLAGSLPNKYLKDVVQWTNRNRTTLLSIWEMLREHKDPSKKKLNLIN